MKRILYTIIYIALVTLCFAQNPVPPGNLKILNAAIPVITITANDPTATEAGRTTGQFTIHRTGSTDEPLYANFSITGTATPGSDYETISTIVTIPAGSSSTTVTIIPKDDSEVEDDETVTLVLQEPTE